MDIKHTRNRLHSIPFRNCIFAFIVVVFDFKLTLQKLSLLTHVMPIFGEQIKEADLIILVDYEEVDKGHYCCHYRLKSNTRHTRLNYKSFKSPKLERDPRDYFQEIFGFLNTASSKRLDEDYVYNRLIRIGSDLYNKFFCNELKEIYWSVVDRNIKSIQIVSNEAWIPWEMIRPFRHDRKKGIFLCEKFNMTRWLAGSNDSDLICISPLGIVKTSSNLESAQTELDGIRREFINKKMNVLEITPPSFGNVNQRLASRGLFGLHFICHGAFNKANPDYSILKLENGVDLRPIDINDQNLTFGRDCSLVFLNACETGIGGEALTGIGGWAEAFIRRAEVSSFIGSVWKSRDKSAYKFSVFFYKKMLEGKTIGEAVRLSRRQIKSKEDPTWLTYSVYANPMAQLLCQYCHEGMSFKEDEQ